MKETESTDEQTNSLNTQIVAFEKLLQHAMNKFSLDKLHHMLQNLSHAIYHGAPRETIASLEQLRTIISTLSNNHQFDDSRHILRYFTMLLDDLKYLQELKQYFDEKIYVTLYEWYYDPLDDVVNDENLNNENGMDSRSRAAEGANQRYVDEDVMQMNFRAPEIRLSEAVNSMIALNKKWGNVLQTESADVINYYDPDSVYQLQSYTDTKLYEVVLRYVPDVFVKAFKSVELAKLWWRRASQLYRGAPIKRRTLKEWTKKENELETHIKTIKSDIKMYEDTVVSKQEELQRIAKRESRVISLSEQWGKLKSEREVTSQKHDALLNELRRLRSQLLELSSVDTKNSKKKDALQKEEVVRVKELEQANSELKLLHYHLGIVQEDYTLELQLNSEVIRQKADAEQKLQELKNNIEKKTKEQIDTEKKLVLLKTNCQKMQEALGSLITGQKVDDE